MARSEFQSDNRESEVDMTPMLDIVFILLIFFIVTTSFVREEGLMVNRPKVNNQPISNNPVMVIKINDAGYVSFNNKTVDIERLNARIEDFLAKHETSNVIVIPDYNTTHEHVVKVIDQVKLFDDLSVPIGK